MSTVADLVTTRRDRVLPRKLRVRLGAVIKGGAGFAVAIGVWELLRGHVLSASIAPSVAQILAALGSAWAHGGLAAAIGTTAEAWAVGLLLSVLIAVPVGAAIGLVRPVDALTSVVIDFLRPIPSVALIPLAVVEFALTVRMQVFMVTFACVWPVLFNARYGVQNVDPVLVETARTMRVGRSAVLRRVILPAALPAVVTGIRTAATIGLLVALAAELISGSPGLGYFIDQMEQGNNVAAAYAGILVSGLMGYVVNALMLSGERRVVGWQRHLAEVRA